jgi:hypothetical protein
MNDTAAPRMVTVTLTVTHADEQYGPNAWLVTSAVDGEAETYWTIETPYNHLGRYGDNVARSIAAQLHLARTQREHRVARLGRLSSVEEGVIQGELDDFDVRAYRAELRLIAHS